VYSSAAFTGAKNTPKDEMNVMKITINPIIFLISVSIPKRIEIIKQ